VFFARVAQLQNKVAHTADAEPKSLAPESGDTGCWAMWRV